ncbi:flagellar hook-associated protein FlgL [Desulfocucumis palustris]|uniref:Flagellar hook-associated protein FlgL n=1 Tax=Desulfocucumis palustris TaxID=1898651 RepID=A0A2L2X8F4_9FIRM|nr:flagellar hook-associated protein FlgL [Desulfocucumis palustris]GBF32282.1 flagellar hook-associated protein FlgL [Desulfocucumis palustris]
MRISNRYITNNVINSIQGNLSRLARSQEQLASTKKVLRPSDNPNAMGSLLSIKNTLSYNEQYSKNIDDGLSYLGMNDTALGTIGDILKKASEYALQAANDTYNPDDRAAVATQIDKMIDQIVDLANSSVGDKYIYAGTDNNAAPFEREGDKIIYKGNFEGLYREVSPGKDYRIDAPGVTTGVEIDGVNNEALASEKPEVTSRQTNTNIVGVLSVKVDAVSGTVTINGKIQDLTDPENPVETDYDNVTMTFDELGTAGDVLDGLDIDFSNSADGSEYNLSFGKLGVFGNVDDSGVVYDPADTGKSEIDKGIFDVLFALRDRLSNNDTDGLQKSIDELDQKNDQALQYRVAIGARTNHFEGIQAQLLDQEVALKANLNNIEGADMEKLTIEYAEQNLAYNASLASGASMMQLSLLDFLR